MIYLLFEFKCKLPSNYNVERLDVLLFDWNRKTVVCLDSPETTIILLQYNNSTCIGPVPIGFETKKISKQYEETQWNSKIFFSLNLWNPYYIPNILEFVAIISIFYWKNTLVFNQYDPTKKCVWFLKIVEGFFVRRSLYFLMV